MPSLFECMQRTIVDNTPCTRKKKGSITAMQNTVVEFYNDSLRKIVFIPGQNQIDWTTSDNHPNLIPGKEYAVQCDADNPHNAKHIYEIKSMLFEIRKVKDSSPFENNRSCSVKVLEYEEGREYPKVENVVVTGYFYNAYPEAIYDSKGFWCSGKDGREIFCITERRQCVSSSENSIKKYLESVLSGSGIGKTVIGKLFNTFSLEVLDKIKNDDPELSTIIKNKEKREKLISLVTRGEDSETSLNFLLQNNISAEQAIFIIKHLGSASFFQISKNPYVLLRFNTIPIEQVFKIAAASNIPFRSKSNVEGLILRYIEHRKENFGDIYVESKDFRDKNGKYTNFEMFYDKYDRYYKFTEKEIQDALTALESRGRIIIKQDVNDESIQCIYDKFFYEMENTIVHKLLIYRNSKSENYVSEDFIRSELVKIGQDSSSFTLDSKQEEAVVNALTNKICVISGGPGTGKTCVTKTIVDIFRKAFPEKKIQLCAPTGKASRRMSEVIGLPACTLHKKLGYGTGMDTPIEEDLLIIDECSMIDIELFYKTLKNVENNTTIVLVGDYNQLPSVGPGLILRDIIDSNVIPSTILENVFRQAGNSEIINAAHHILKKETGDINSDFGKDFVFIEQETSNDVYQNISGCINYLLQQGVDPDQIQILSPQNEGMVGTHGLNNMMRDVCNPEQLRGIGKLIGNTMFFPGDRIIETENDSELGIFNGSIGKILAFDSDGFLADFDDHRVVLTDADMKSIKLGYAITVHKSQGSGATRS